MSQTTTIREAVGVFDDLTPLQEAVNDLQASGFERREISVLGSEAAVVERFGKSYVRTETLEDDPRTPRAADIKEEDLGIGQGVLISIGVLLGVIGGFITINVASADLSTLVLAAVVGGSAGAIIGAILAIMMGHEYTGFFKRQIQEGGLLLWVNTSDSEKETLAQKILRKHGARRVHVHEIPAYI